MSGPELERFAQGLMALVRDRAIEACDRLAEGRMAGPDGERWNSVVEDGSAREALLELIPDIVDQTLFEMLNAIDLGELPLAWRTQDGAFVALEEQGSAEMAGWLMGSEGWRSMYSAQRFFDPLDDLRLEIDWNRDDET